MNTQKIASIIIITFALVFFFIIAQSIIIPIILAVFSWFLIKEIREVLDRVPFIKKHIPRWVKTIFSVSLLLVTISFFSDLLINNIQNLANSVQKYNAEFINIINSIESNTSLNITSNTKDFVSSINLSSTIKTFLNSISGLLSNLFLVLIYLIFILMEESTFVRKMKAIYPDKATYDNINNVLLKVDKSIGSYISIKTVVSLLTASLSYFTLLLIGIDSALFFAFLIFLLNYIPSIGSLIATVFPALMALVQYGGETYTPFILVVVLVGAIQLLIGNFLEPKLMGNSLNISSLVVILSLTIWGVIWGVAGMVLSVPITVIMIIIFSNFESTKKIAILLSEKGEINVKD
jgi:AI-2 transport protein TqsA